jgi:hypothetical protein
MLVAMAYDYERATHPRVPPSTTPPLVNGHAPKPWTYEASARVGAGAAVSGTFAYDPMRRTLTYSASASGVPAARVFAITIDRDSSGVKGPVMEVLTVPGDAKVSGVIELNASERGDLAAGRLSLVLYTADAPLGSLRAPLKPKAQR